MLDTVVGFVEAHLLPIVVTVLVAAFVTGSFLGEINMWWTLVGLAVGVVLYSWRENYYALMISDLHEDLINDLFEEEED